MSSPLQTAISLPLAEEKENEAGARSNGTFAFSAGDVIGDQRCNALSRATKAK